MADDTQILTGAQRVRRQLKKSGYQPCIFRRIDS